MKMQESGEDYLETILILSRNRPEVRSIDIANELGYSKPSISRAVHLLEEHGYIDMDKGGAITLTEKGRKVANEVYERHEFLTKFLVGLGVDEAVAANDACRMEHIISAESFSKMKDFAKKHVFEK